MKRTLLPAAFLVAIFLGGSSPASAAVKPNPLFSDGMVLQRGMPVPVWGTANDGERVTVTFQGQRVSATAKDGKWMVRLRGLKAGGPFEMTIAGENTIPVKNVLVGEVWIASGQSNMQFALRQSTGADEAIATSRNPQIRLLTIERKATDEPLTEVAAKWEECGPETVPNFSGVAYFFGRDLQKALDVPVGLISTNVGGTPAEAWTSRGVLENHPQLKQILANHAKAQENFPQAQAHFQEQMAQYRQAAEKARQTGQPVPAAPRPPAEPAKSAQRPTGLYNAMIAPLLPYAIRGAIWYQGESNAGRAYEYGTLFPAMIRNWRQAWGQGDFPFLFVQLAPFMKITSEPGESAWAELREAQRQTVYTLPNTGMAVITDVGEENDIHPKQKEPVGKRLALAALAVAYGKEVEYSGPEFRRMRVEGNKAVLTFSHEGKGLVAKGGTLTGFTIAGSDKKWVNAQAEIREEKDGDRVVVWSPEVARPVAVRYGWANFPLGNLWNAAGLPASPFRTDDWPTSTMPAAAAAATRR